nr:MAG TPA: RK RWP-RK domain [Caudoviricetes sp.]DAN67431.1 MAG TPA: RK RWP-RK domain [Caudoviricetes sp.]
MEYKIFEEILENAKISKKDFSEIAKIPYQTIMNWKRIDSVPDWVEPFVENYIKSIKFDKARKIFNDEFAENSK